MGEFGFEIRFRKRGPTREFQMHTECVVGAMKSQFSANQPTISLPEKN